MRKYRTEILQGAAIVLVVVLFSLILLPGVLVWIHPEKTPGTPKNLILDVPSVDVPVYRRESKVVEQVPMEEYVRGVVSGEMPSSFEMEALKAQAVAARTYALSKIQRAVTGNPTIHPEAPLCDDVHCQVYRTTAELEKLKGKQWMEDGYQKISEAVSETAGQVMYYQGALVEQPLFHSSSGGKTENSEDVFTSALPYLRSVDSLFEEEAPHQQEKISVSLSTFSSKIKSAYPNAGIINKSNIKISSRSEGGRVDKITAGKAKLSGRKVRDLFGLRSANFTIEFSNDDIIFTTSGYGHGVGMSQYGANGMAKAGYGYVDILSHYYSGIDIDLIK